MYKEEQTIEYKWYHHVILCVIFIPIIAFRVFYDEIMLRFDLYKCVKSGECIYKEFNGGKYLAKNKASEEFIPYLLKYPVVVNTKTGTIHRDGCPMGKMCTETCIYMEEEKAFKMLKKNSLMHYCRIEEVVLENTNPDKYAEYCTECYADRFTDGDCWVDYNCTARETIYRFFKGNTIQDALELFN